MMVSNYKELACGLCNLKVVEQYAIDRQKRMTVHWNTEHHNALPPVFDQNTWRTGVVQPLSYTSNTETGRMSVNDTCAEKHPTTPPTTTMTHERAQVLVREIIGPNKRSKKRYQTYVRLPNITESIYLPTTESLADARAQKDALHAMLVHALHGSAIIELLDFI